MGTPPPDEYPDRLHPTPLPPAPVLRRQAPEIPDQPTDNFEYSAIPVEEQRGFSWLANYPHDPLRFVHQICAQNDCSLQFLQSVVFTSQCSEGGRCCRTPFATNPRHGSHKEWSAAYPCHRFVSNTSICGGPGIISADATDSRGNMGQKIDDASPCCTFGTDATGSSLGCDPTTTSPINHPACHPSRSSSSRDGSYSSPLCSGIGAIAEHVS